MRWQEDVSVADWLKAAISDERRDITMHTVVPRGFEAYARVFHPASKRTLPGGVVPSAEEFVRLPRQTQAELIARFVDARVTWHEAAQAFGTTMHPLAQWHAIVGATEPYQESSTAAGADYTAPDEGFGGADLVASVVATAIQHTQTPHDGFSAVWEGWGGVVGGNYGIGQRYATFTEEQPEPHRSFLASLKSTLFENPYGKKTWQSGFLPDDVSRGTRLSLPDRDHVLFAGDISTFADPQWITEVPWSNTTDPAWTNGPSLVWPADRSWVVVSEIDFDSTIVAGSQALISAIVSNPQLEALQIPEGGDLTYGGDGVNS